MADYARPAFAPQPKPGRGTANTERDTKQRKVERLEDQIKADAKLRDNGKCRWPHVPAERRRCARELKHAAHGRHKGMGGDPRLLRTTRPNLITYCATTHRLAHDGKRRAVPLTPKQFDGPCAFEEEREGQWIEVGREIAVGRFARASRTTP
ncbi:MAG: hypothetical protein ACJ79O_26950 [Myxococcales bacterium]